MSTFNGKLLEIKNISIDNFEGDNINSYAYFLSHCHTDHMRGLKYDSFQNSFQTRRNVFIYTSSVSASILSKDKTYLNLSSYLKVLKINDPVLITLPNDKRSFSVTAMPAGHCPGSVMFLFETDDATILYTGDFRIDPDDILKYEPLKSQGALKKINKIYMDTTFFLSVYQTFPKRNESVREICKLINDWIGRDQDNVVSIETSAKYGSEYLFIEIYDTLKIPIHVSDELYDFYCSIPEMDKVVTKSANTKLHSSCIAYKKICRCSLGYIRTIKVSAYRWCDTDFVNGIVECDDISNKYLVCYSCHSSMTECWTFVKLLQPDEIEPCVVYENEEKQKDMNRLIQQSLSKVMDRSRMIEDSFQFKKSHGKNVACNIDCESSKKRPLPKLGSPSRSFGRRRNRKD